MIQIFIYIIMAITVLNPIYSITQISEPRKPIEKSDAIASFIASSLSIWLFIEILKQLN